jgi:LmbE family N-acetylglucosaminyl deacetylase
MAMTLRAGEILAMANAFPYSTLEERIGGGGLVIIAPHPDDESLACGGLIAEARAQGRSVKVVIVSDGSGSHSASKTYPRARLRDLREDEARQAVTELGLDASYDIVFLRLRDRFVPSRGASADEAVAKIVAIIRDVDAQALFVSWRHDPHCDHQASYWLARTVQHSVPGVKLFEYTVWGSALPPDAPLEASCRGFRIPISPWRQKKQRAIAAHRSQTTSLIADDPSGFCLTASDLARFDLPYESFFESDE